MPQLRNGILTMMHGEQKGRTMGEPLPYTQGGGIFGGSQLPVNRTGIFKSQYALPWNDMIDNTIGVGRNSLPDRYQRSSGQPVRGIVPKRMAGRQCPQVPGTINCPRQDLSGMGSASSALGAGAGLVVGGLLLLALFSLPSGWLGGK